MPWEEPDIETDENAVTGRILEGLMDRLPGWEPAEGAPEVALAEEIGRETVILNQQTIEVLDLAVAGMGETAFGFPAYLGVPATIAVNITVTGVGAVIPAGFTVVGINDNGDEIAFDLDTEIVATATTVPATLTALESGNVGNGVPADDLTIVTATATVITVTATAPSSNGADPEDMGEYLERLVDYLGTLRPGGVLAADLAALARSVPGVYRALGVDLYDPANPAVPAERTATVFPIDENSDPVNPTVAALVQATLEGAREVNFIVHVDEPTYTPIHITYDAVAETGADPVAVQSAVTAAIVAWLTTWGSTPDDETAWTPKPAVRILELARVAGTATGVAYIAAMTINGASADYNLPGVAALPASVNDPTTPSTVTGTVSP